jgi:sialic acid synthase SpsE
MATMIIAEIGQNWDAIEQYKELIYLAKENGADLVKGQLFDYEKLYPNHNIPDRSLSQQQAALLFEYSKSIGIELFFSVFDIEKVQWCEEIGVKRYKIASLLRDDKVCLAVKATGKDIIESVADAYGRFVYPHKKLYCPDGYPQHDINLRNLMWSDGFSDHTIGIDMAKIVLARGCGIATDTRETILEKHFAIDHDTGVDALWSMTPKELYDLKQYEKLCQASVL